MPLYYFHLREGVDIILDEEGIQFDDLAEVQKAALLDARALISADAKTGTIRLDMRIDVEDAAGILVHSIEFADVVEIVRSKTG